MFFGLYPFSMPEKMVPSLINELLQAPGKVKKIGGASSNVADIE